MRASLVIPCCYLESPWSSKRVSSRADICHSESFSCPIKEMPFCPWRFCVGHRLTQGILNGKNWKQSKNFQRKYGNLRKSTFYPPHVLILCIPSPWGLRHKHQSHFSFKSTTAHFCFFFFWCLNSFSIFLSFCLSFDLIFIVFFSHLVP